MATLEKLIHWANHSPVSTSGWMCVYPPPQATAPLPKVSTLLTNSTPVKATFKIFTTVSMSKLQALIARRQGARPDGYAIVDLSQFLAYAALNKDRRLYTPTGFRGAALDFDNSSDPYTWGLSLALPGRFFSRCIGNHRSFTLAQSLWLGSQVFGDKLIASKPS